MKQASVCLQSNLGFFSSSSFFSFLVVLTSLAAEKSWRGKGLPGVTLPIQLGSAVALCSAFEWSPCSTSTKLQPDFLDFFFFLE